MSNIPLHQRFEKLQEKSSEQEQIIKAVIQHFFGKDHDHIATHDYMMDMLIGYKEKHEIKVK